MDLERNKAVVRELDALTNGEGDIDRLHERDPRINAARIAGRVMEGGHSVPIEKIVSRYSRSMANLAPGIQIADRFYLYDNSVEDADARLCVRTMNGQLRKIYGTLPDSVHDAIAALPVHPEFVDARGG